MATMMPPKQQNTYTFSSQPRTVTQRPKYRDPLNDATEEPPFYGNIMYDRRVVRGNTYAQSTLPAHAQPDPIELERQQENRRRAIARKRARDQLKPRSPEPVEGRRHVDVQTELYLEELSDRVEEADVDVQTDAFLDRPPTPLFVPAKTGMDVETQIYPDDLFDFDIEVRPILEVLVGKTVEQSLLEVMEEEELANLRAQQREFEELRNAELVEQQRLEEQERRHREEKNAELVEPQRLEEQERHHWEEKIRRMKQQKLVLEKEKESAEKIAARAFAQSYLSDLVPSVFGTLADHGYFFDPVERDIEQGFMPWLMEQVAERLEKNQDGRTMLDAIIRDVVLSREARSEKPATPSNLTSKQPSLVSAVPSTLPSGIPSAIPSTKPSQDSAMPTERESELAVPSAMEQETELAQETDVDEPPQDSAAGDE